MTLQPRSANQLPPKRTRRGGEKRKRKENRAECRVKIQGSSAGKSDMCELAHVSVIKSGLQTNLCCKQVVSFSLFSLTSFISAARFKHLYLESFKIP